MPLICIPYLSLFKFFIGLLVSLNLWAHETHHVTLDPQVLSSAHIKIAVAGGAVLTKELQVVGKIAANRDTLASVYPRYSGIIKKLAKNLGDEVVQGEPLVTIESNDTLQSYTINAPISGTIVQKQGTNGELAKGDKPIYEIANLNDVWADLTLYRKDLALVKKGMRVVVTGDDGAPCSENTITYISPLGIEDSQTTFARALLSNIKQQWVPGMYVNGIIIIKEKDVRVAVPPAALQKINGLYVVFVQEGNEYKAVPVEVGDKSHKWIEIIKGLEPGQRYVRENSFLLKAELGKEGAAHEH